MPRGRLITVIDGERSRPHSGRPFRCSQTRRMMGA